MKTRNLSAAGAIHPILFFACIYAVALLFSIFICSAIFYRFSGDTSGAQKFLETGKKPETSAFAN